MGDFVIGGDTAAADAFGWTGASPAHDASPTTPEPALAGTLVPDQAIRSRLAAIVIDNIIVSVPIGVLAAALGSSVHSPDILLVILGAQFLYFFAFELLRGQTIGKRQYHLRVVSLDGSAPTMRQIAIRNLLRFIDALPIGYASGQVSMIRTGPARRQRLGDVVAGTTVVLDGDGRQLRTPRWLLPLTTLIALGLSVLVIVGVVNAQPSPYSPASQSQLPPLTGFAGGSSQPPLVGTLAAQGTVSWSVGYGNEQLGVPFVRAWTITRNCRAASNCQYWLTREVTGTAPVSAVLTPEADGWHASFALGPYSCGQVNGSVVTWVQQSSMILQFSAGGAVATAHERSYSYAPQCGYGSDGVTWVAQRRGS
jgi:uncharacterized RDD family membrane protein YckC